jgi:hypothetical protein
MDAAGQVLLRKTTDPDADGEIVWSWPPDAEATFARPLHERSRATGARKPGLRGEHV